MTNERFTPLEIGEEEFRKIGYQLTDRIAGFLSTIRDRKVTSAESPSGLKKILGSGPIPEKGTSPVELLELASGLLINHSLFNGHPRFFGYITGSAAPVGVLADLLAAAINPNVGANILSPMATEIEKQTIGWLAEFIGLSPEYGGILVSGGNMANFVGFLAGRTAKAPENFKKEGVSGTAKLMTYCSKSTHTWIEKAAVLFGHGLNAIRWIETDTENRMNLQVLERTINEDLKNGLVPIIVVGTAGDVSTGVVDDLDGIADICSRYNLWFHADGAYGIPAAAVPEYKSLFSGIEKADSIALDPHKWLYSPLEAGCTLVKNRKFLTDTFSYHPVYYHFDQDEEPSTNFYEYGFQNSRGFRALKVWLALKQAGKEGYIKMIRDDISLSKLMFDLAQEHAELEALTQQLSIATFRYVPPGFNGKSDEEHDYLNKLNSSLLGVLEKGGELFLSNAVVDGKYCLRTCIVNFRTTKKDIEEVIDIIVREGRKLHQQLQ